jgi:spore coat polysaccharide biosynthesis protein SpsF
MKTACIIQARMTSTRLPGKVLRTLDYDTGATILDEVIRRVKLARGVDEIIVATTVNEADDPIIEASKKAGASTFRGSEQDVLARYYLAASERGIGRIVRVTSDCPFIDPGLIDELIVFFDRGDHDYASNRTGERIYPDGTDCEICSFAALKSAYDNTTDEPSREHVTYYIRMHPEKYRIGSVEPPEGEDYRDIRITVDTKQDYALACVLKAMLCPHAISFRDILSLLTERPYLKLINESVLEKKVYTSMAEEMKDAARLLRLQEMDHAAELIEKGSMNRSDYGR